MRVKRLLEKMNIDEQESSFTNRYTDISKIQGVPRHIIRSGKLIDGTEFRLAIIKEYEIYSYVYLTLDKWKYANIYFGSKPGGPTLLFNNLIGGSEQFIKWV